jgi:glycine/D-amino acid oxidase-like deaminating enzyme
VTTNAPRARRRQSPRARPGGTRQSTLVHKRDLRTGRSVWQDRPLPGLAQSTLRRDLTTDVLVIGAGISGAMIAELLSDAGLRVVVVDRRGPVLGSTAASTALLQYELDLPLHRLATRIGRTRAERIWRRSRLALEALRERARELGLDADLQDRCSLYLDGNVLDSAGLHAEAEARRRAGFEVTYLARGALQRRFGIGGRCALLSQGNMTADPRRLAAGLLRAAVARGARLHAPVEVSEVDASASVVHCATTRGPQVRASHVVFATGYEMPRGVPRNGHTIVSTWVIATRAQPRATWPGGALVWEASDPYLYLRTTPDGRVICGGEDEPFVDEGRRDALLPAKTATLERRLARLFPALDARAQYRWTGSFGASPTGTPTIGPIPGMPRCYAALGYGGNGITFSMMAAQMLRGLVLGRGDPDSDLVAFGRKR